MQNAANRKAVDLLDWMMYAVKKACACVPWMVVDAPGCFFPQPQGLAFVTGGKGAINLDYVLAHAMMTI